MPPDNIAAKKHTKKQAQASRLITSTITPEILLQLGDTILQLTPYGMIQCIVEHFEQEITPETHESLHIKAPGLTIKANETIEDYPQRHVVLRNEMRRAQYTEIDNEQITIVV